GGSTAAARNVISGNGGSILIENAGTTGNLVQGNYVGTDITGTKALPNGDGILIEQTSNNTIGGSTAGSGNLISGNGLYGVALPDATGNQVQGNFIGTDVTGTNPIPNDGPGIT